MYKVNIVLFKILWIASTLLSIVVVSYNTVLIFFNPLTYKNILTSNNIIGGTSLFREIIASEIGLSLIFVFAIIIVVFFNKSTPIKTSLYLTIAFLSCLLIYSITVYIFYFYSLFFYGILFTLLIWLLLFIYKKFLENQSVVLFGFLLVILIGLLVPNISAFAKRSKYLTYHYSVYRIFQLNEKSPEAEVKEIINDCRNSSSFSFEFDYCVNTIVLKTYNINYCNSFLEKNDNPSYVRCRNEFQSRGKLLYAEGIYNENVSWATNTGSKCLTDVVSEESIKSCFIEMAVKNNDDRFCMALSGVDAFFCFSKFYSEVNNCSNPKDYVCYANIAVSHKDINLCVYADVWEGRNNLGCVDKIKK